MVWFLCVDLLSGGCSESRASFQNRHRSCSGVTTSLSQLRRRVSCLRTTHGCLVPQPTTGVSSFGLFQMGIPPDFPSQGHALCLSSCKSESSWTEIPHASGTDSDVSCKKEVQVSLNRQLANGHRFKFCLTNSLGCWCKTLHVVESELPSAGRKIDFIQGKGNKTEFEDSMLCFIDAVASPNDNFNRLKAAILVLLVALLVVTVMLFYFVKKKVTINTSHTCVSSCKVMQSERFQTFGFFHRNPSISPSFR